MRLIAHIGEWFDQRLQLAAPIREAAEHPVPRNTASWWYVFGSAALTVFLLQLVTGILLALIYVPSAGEAWSSLQALNHDITLGWFIRAMHGWGSNFMVAIVLIHMVQVFLFGAHKFPRELTWIIGVFLLLMTLGMAFSGQVLRFDQDAYWGLGIGASIASRVPITGPAIVKLMLGGPDHRRRHPLPILRAARLRDSWIADRFREPSRLDGAEAGNQRMADAGTHRETRNLRSRVSRTDQERWRAFRSLCRLERYVFRGLHPPGSRRVRVLLRSVWADRAARSDNHPDRTEARLLLPVALCPALAAPALARDTSPSHWSRPWSSSDCFCLPFLSGEGEKSWKRRPIAVLTVMLIAITLGTFTHLAEFTPWSPQMNAWSGDPVPDDSCTAQPRSSGRARLCFRSSSAATAIPSARRAGRGVRLWTVSRCGLRRTSSSAR